MPTLAALATPTDSLYGHQIQAHTHTLTHIDDVSNRSQFEPEKEGAAVFICCLHFRVTLSWGSDALCMHQAMKKCMASRKKEKQSQTKDNRSKMLYRENAENCGSESFAHTYLLYLYTVSLFGLYSVCILSSDCIGSDTIPIHTHYLLYLSQ